MSVSHPLLKELKVYVVEFRTRPKENPVRDHNPRLRGFCQLLETILSKGLKDAGTFFGKQKRTVWHCVDALARENNSRMYNPTFQMSADSVRNSERIKTCEGRSRAFIRNALQKKILHHYLDCLMRSAEFRESWYDDPLSIVGNEILSQILMSLLKEIGEIYFKLNPRNCAFLDETWLMPIHRSYEFVPCKDLGIIVELLEGRVIVEIVHKDSVAGEDDRIEPGDVLDELYGEVLRNVKRGKMPQLIKDHQGLPVYISIIKARLPDGSVFPPISSMLRRGNKTIHSLQQARVPPPRQLAQDELISPDGSVVPPHAQLEEDEMDERVPVSNADDSAKYTVLYIGKLCVGPHGGVDSIEVAIQRMLQIFKDEREAKMVRMELGETETVCFDQNSSQELLRHSYTEISSCGRRIDSTNYFAYIAGETTCTLARDFYCYLFKSSADDESKTILCTIAQGFERTHWFV